MTARRVTLIVSDLHMGGGAADRGDDFVHQRGQFERFLDEQRASAEGRDGEIELIFNGDTFELAQVRPDVYTLNSAEYWCSEDESLEKLRYVLDGHRGIVAALRRFMGCGNAVTMAAGNHDVELYWPTVRSTLQKEIGGVEFELGAEWYTRYDSKLAIAHGHMLDPANRFVSWVRPIVNAPDGERLEMCPGTLFMVKLVNVLEAQFPFADNLHPVTALARILAKDQRSSLPGAAWLLGKFAARHSLSMLDADGADGSSDVRLQQALLEEPRRFREFVEAWREVVDSTATDRDLRSTLSQPDGLARPFLELMARLPLERWMRLASLPAVSLSLESDRKDADGTLSIIESGWQESEEVLREAAQQRMRTGAVVVVMGHTHQPDILETADGVYFNPGSWTRYVNAASIGALTIDSLKDEEAFPYQLNYVRVEADQSNRLSARLTTFEERTGFRYGQRLNLSAPGGGGASDLVGDLSTKCRLGSP